MNKTTYQIAGHITADNVSNVNSDNSINIELQDTESKHKDNTDCLGPKNNSNYCFFKVANAFLLLAVLLLFVLLCFYAPRVIKGNSLGFDYMGVIVAVLGILVTTLIGWQIYSTIKVREELERYKELFPIMQKTVSEKLKRDIRDYDKQVQGGIYLVIGLSWSMKGKYEYALDNFIKGLEFQNEYYHPLYEDELVEMIDGIAIHKDYSWLTKEMREKTIRVLGNSKSNKRIKAIERYVKITL